MRRSYARRLTRKKREQASRVETVLDATCELFCQRPISRVSTEDIAGRAGLPLGVVYDLFGSKDQLAGDALLRCQDNLFDELEQIVMSVEDPVEQIHSMISRYLQFFERYSAPLRFYYDSLDNPSLEVRRETFSVRCTRATEFIRTLTRVCANGQATGRFAADMPAYHLAVAVHAVPHAFLFALIESDHMVIADMLPHAHVCVDRILDIEDASSG